jgi:hypothetical protein
MSVELATTPARLRFPAISWPAIFAALAVGVAVQLLLTLAGFAFGILAAERGMGSTETITLAAAGWTAVTMLIAALLGGYVAARASGLRRTGDGVMHGLVSWAASTVLYAVLATTAVGGLTTGLFGLLAPSMMSSATSDQSASASASAQGVTGTEDERQQATRVLTEIGLTAEQANNVLDRIFRGGSPSAGTSAGADEAARGLGSATLWLAATALLSLLLAILGGIGGSRAMRRMVRPVQREFVRSEPRVLSRT